MMQTINLGQAANDGTGDPLRQGGQKINANFAELDTRTTAAQTQADKGVSDALAAQTTANAAQPKEAGKGLSTNDYTTTEKNKLSGIASGATANSSDAVLLNRANHTGSQLASTISNFATTALAVVLSGLSVATGGAVVATDSILVAIGKLQNQITNIATSVRSTVLAGLDLTSSTAITATDTILSAMGKLQAQVTARAMKGANSDITSLSGLTTALSIVQGGTGGSSQGGAQTALGLVPVSSNTDTTPGRLLIPGWMGLGSTLAIPLPGGNANQILPSGIYWTNTSWTGSPYPGTDPRNRGQIFVQPWGDATYQTQSFTPLFSASANPKLERAALAGVWRAWDPVIGGLSALSDPANETGGLMSSSVVSGFTVTKYANGEMHIIGNLGSTAALAINTHTQLDFTIPSGFVGINEIVPGVGCVPTLTFDFYGIVSQYMVSTTLLRVVVRNGATSQTATLKLSIWGRWK